MVIKLPLIVTPKGPVQILNPLLDKGFISIRAEKIEINFVRPNYAPELGDFWCFLTKFQKQKTPQIQYMQGF